MEIERICDRHGLEPCRWGTRRADGLPISTQESPAARPPSQVPKRPPRLVADGRERSPGVIYPQDMAGGGVVAVGDSAIHGGFTRQQFITPQSWAQHLAEAGDWPFTRYARGGHTSGQVVDEQLPLITRDDYDVGAVSVGANDLQFGWDAERFAANMEAILARLADVADRVLVTTVPPAFRRLPGADRRINQSVPQANDIITGVASAQGAHVIDLADFTSRRWLRPDRAHPTALGSAEIGQRAAAVLGLGRAPADARRLGAAYSLRHACGLAWHSAWLSIARVRRR
jgi:lysophospholipase L1-like esterase